MNHTDSNSPSKKRVDWISGRQEKMLQLQKHTFSEKQIIFTIHNKLSQFYS